MGSVRSRAAQAPKDVNGPPIPDSPRGIPLLGDGDGSDLISTEIYMGEILSPSGFAGTGMVHHPPSPFPAYPPREAWLTLN
jgi:hypothetical protein